MNQSFPSSFETIANGLSENGYAIIDDFLTQREVDQILALDDFKNALLHFKKAGTGKQVYQINESIRGDYIQWVDKRTSPESISTYLLRLEQLTGYLNQTLFLSLKDYEVHMTMYPAGSFYKRHFDQFKMDDHRKLSVICYLNSNWKENEGGQIRMHLRENALDIFPIAGRLVCFRSDQIEHEVLPATRDRFSLTGWMLDQLSDLRNL